VLVAGDRLAARLLAKVGQINTTKREEELKKDANGHPDPNPLRTFQSYCDGGARTDKPGTNGDARDS
jgi:hypothetical protein